MRPLWWSQVTGTDCPPTSAAVGVTQVAGPPAGPLAGNDRFPGVVWNVGGGNVTLTGNITAGGNRVPPGSFAWHVTSDIPQK